MIQHPQIWLYGFFFALFISNIPKHSLFCTRSYDSMFLKMVQAIENELQVLNAEEQEKLGELCKILGKNPRK